MSRHTRASADTPGSVGFVACSVAAPSSAERSRSVASRLLRNLSCPASCGWGWIHPDHTHGAMPIVINVSLEPRFEVDQVTIYGCLFIVGLPRATPWVAPIPSVSNICFVCQILVVKCLRHSLRESPPHSMFECNFNHWNFSSMLCSSAGRGREWGSHVERPQGLSARKWKDSYQLAQRGSNRQLGKR